MKKFKYIAIFIACNSIVNVWASKTAWIETSQYSKDDAKYQCCQKDNDKPLWVDASNACGDNFILVDACDKDTHMFNEPNKTLKDKAHWHDFGVGN